MTGAPAPGARPLGRRYPAPPHEPPPAAVRRAVQAFYASLLLATVSRHCCLP
jgi:hypothetical protein